MSATVRVLDTVPPIEVRRVEHVLDFHQMGDYAANTEREFFQREALPPVYTWNTESKIVRVVKLIFSVILFPIGLYKLLHILAGKFVLLPASTPSLMGYPKDYAHQTRLQLPLDGEWKYKRISIEVDGYTIDAAIVGKTQTLDPRSHRRWIVWSGGNGEFYENQLRNGSPLKRLATELDANGIVFNYPGVGASTGLPSRQAMVKAYRAILQFVEDQERGLGAREIIGYGHSIGGGVQGDALKTHELKDGIEYVFVKSRTFSDLRSATAAITSRPLGWLVKLIGWNLDSVESSKQLAAPEIILQTARVERTEELRDSSRLLHDGVIPREASLAKALLDDPSCPKRNKVFLGVGEGHNDPLEAPRVLADRILRFL